MEVARGLLAACRKGAAADTVIMLDGANPMEILCMCCVLVWSAGHLRGGWGVVRVNRRVEEIM